VPADTNNGDVAVYHKNHKNPPKSRFRQLQLTAMVGIAPDYRVGMHLNRGACQPFLQVVGAADRSFEFEVLAGVHQQRRKLIAVKCIWL